MNARRDLLRPLEASDSVEQERSCQFALTFRGSGRRGNVERAEDQGRVRRKHQMGERLLQGKLTERYSHCEVAQIQEIVRKRELLKKSVKEEIVVGRRV